MKTIDQLHAAGSTDPLDVLAAARPTEDALTRSWSATRAQAVLDSLEARATADLPMTTSVRLTPRRSRRRWVALGAAAALAAVAAFGATTVLAPDGTLPRAAAIERLARAAETARTPSLGPGQYIHLVMVTTQEGRDDQTPALDLTNESWTDVQGTSWRRDVSRMAPIGTTYFQLPPAALGDDPFWGTQPADYDQWPTDPPALRAFLARHFYGGRPVPDQALSQPIFETLSDRFAQGMTPASLNAAMIRVLGSLPEVHTDSVTFAGHEAVRLEYRGLYTNALFFDRESAAFLGETSSGTQTVVTGHEIVDGVPADVRGKATVETSTDTPESGNGGASAK